VGSIQEIIDGLTAHVAVLAGDGTIGAVNAAWRRFAEANGDPGLVGTGPGADYLTACHTGDVTSRWATSRGWPATACAPCLLLLGLGLGRAEPRILERDTCPREPRTATRSLLRQAAHCPSARAEPR
jgi:hypothetical protein